MTNIYKPLVDQRELNRRYERTLLSAHEQNRRTIRFWRSFDTVSKATTLGVEVSMPSKVRVGEMHSLFIWVPKACLESLKTAIDSILEG